MVLLKYQLTLHFLFVNHFHNEGPHFFKIDDRVSDSLVVPDEQVKDFAVSFRRLVEVQQLVLAGTVLLPDRLTYLLAILLVLMSHKVMNAIAHKVIVLLVHGEVSLEVIVHKEEVIIGVPPVQLNSLHQS